MTRIEVVNHVTLDGVMQAPADPDEDRRGGFEHGGWATEYFDDVQGEYMGSAHGRRRIRRAAVRPLDLREDGGFWPKQPEDNMIRQVMTRATKYVVSNTLAGAARVGEHRRPRRATPWRRSPT